MLFGCFSIKICMLLKLFSRIYFPKKKELSKRKMLGRSQFTFRCNINVVSYAYMSCQLMNLSY